MTTNLNPAAPGDSTYTRGPQLRVDARWADLGVGVLLEHHPSGAVTPGIELYEYTKHIGMMCLFNGPLSCDEALKLARTLVAAVDEAREGAENSDDPCGGSGKVRISTGRWNYTAPCPSCHPEDFAACEVDGDHFIIGPAVAR